MTELLLILAVVFVLRLLRGATRAPARQIRIEVHHHFHPVPGPGERDAEPLVSAEVVPLAPHRPPLRIVGRP